MAFNRLTYGENGLSRNGQGAGRGEGLEGPGSRREFVYILPPWQPVCQMGRSIYILHPRLSQLLVSQATLKVTPFRCKFGAVGGVQRRGSGGVVKPRNLRGSRLLCGLKSPGGWLF
jgi:hypothetical protein